jgi:hypothetical protein
MTIRGPNGNFECKDSLSLIPAPLRDFPKMFGLDAGEKELFPYNY